MAADEVPGRVNQHRGLVGRGRVRVDLGPDRPALTGGRVDHDDGRALLRVLAELAEADRVGLLQRRRRVEPGDPDDDRLTGAEAVVLLVGLRVDVDVGSVRRRRARLEVDPAAGPGAVVGDRVVVVRERQHASRRALIADEVALVGAAQIDRLRLAVGGVADEIALRGGLSRRRLERPRLTARHLRTAVLGELDLGESLAALGELDLLGPRERPGLRRVEGARAELDLHLDLLALASPLGELALRLDLDLDAALQDALLAVAEDLQRHLLLAPLGGGHRVGRSRGGERRADRQGEQGCEQPERLGQDGLSSISRMTAPTPGRCAGARYHRRNGHDPAPPRP